MKYFKFLGFSGTLLTLILDQLSKQVVLSWFLSGNHQIEVTSFFNIILAANRGVSFGLFAAGSSSEVWALIAVAGCISFLLGLWIWQADSKFSSICFGLVLGGALGNVIDRFFYGAVIDFLDFHAFGYHWYTFNIADCGIVIGAVLLVCQMLFSIKTDNNNEA
ncbi:signal peptidase II [Candidatus Paracaedibacter symbiosus]|uniref:signal peptidase II n=1 Tax=Candidatus Paracaedibacter symbiosus TaxID=244582 RepID=UPI000509AFF4|nr:signal peptidase II [Candidatus Paracaedibacter symbiosus]